MNGKGSTITKITLYSLPASACAGCKFTKRKFEQLGIRYEEILLASTPGAMDFVRSLGYTSAPVVVAEFGDGASASWSGYAPSKIEQLKATLG